MTTFRKTIVMIQDTMTMCLLEVPTNMGGTLVENMTLFITEVNPVLKNIMMSLMLNSKKNGSNTMMNNMVKNNIMIRIHKISLEISIFP
jgi:hypothetical protein